MGDRGFGKGNDVEKGLTTLYERFSRLYVIAEQPKDLNQNVSVICRAIDLHSASMVFLSTFLRLASRKVVIHVVAFIISGEQLLTSAVHKLDVAIETLNNALIGLGPNITFKTPEILEGMLDSSFLTKFVQESLR